MFRKDLIGSEESSAGPLSSWLFFSVDGTTANITVTGFEFAAQDEGTAMRCKYINRLLMDPANGV
jgi:hypothetical protein